MTTTDKFGVIKVFEDQLGAPSFYLGDEDPNNNDHVNNPETDGNRPTLEAIDAGTYRIYKIRDNQEVRYAVAASKFDGNQIDAWFPTAKARGYLQDDDNDGQTANWGDIEMTAYYRWNETKSGCTKNGGPHFEHVMRGQRSTNDTGKYGQGAKSCAFNYHANLYFKDGRLKYERDFDHSAHYSKGRHPDDNKLNATGAWQKGQWVGYKTICYNIEGGVRLESWVDLSGSGSSWRMAHHLEDKGEWKVADPNTVKQHCGVTGQPPITFAGPICVFRSDCMADYDIRWASVRSIDSSKRLVQP